MSELISYLHLSLIILTPPPSPPPIYRYAAQAGGHPCQENEGALLDQAAQ